MADRDPVWIPLVVGAIIIAAWSAILGIVAGTVIWLTDVNRSAVAIVCALFWWYVFLPVAKRVRADLKGDADA